MKSVRSVIITCQLSWSGLAWFCSYKVWSAKQAVDRLLHSHLHGALVTVQKTPYCGVLRMRDFRACHLTALNNSLNIKCVVFNFSTNLSEIFCIIRRTERDVIETVYRSSCEVSLYLCGFSETWVFWTYFLKKYSNITFHENPSSGRRFLSCGQTDRHDEADSRFAEFCECARQRRTAFFSRPTGWPANRPVSDRLRLAHCHLSYSVQFFLLFDSLGSVLRVPFFLDRHVLSFLYDTVSRRWHYAAYPHFSTANSTQHKLLLTTHLPTPGSPHRQKSQYTKHKSILCNDRLLHLR